MQNITGKIAFGGIAIGKIKEISKENNVVRRVKIEDAKAEIARFEAARDQDRKSTRLNSSHSRASRMPSSA